MRKDKEFIQFRAGKSKTYLALLGAGNGYSRRRAPSNFIPALEVDDIEAMATKLRRRGIRSLYRIMDFTHIRLGELMAPEGNLLQLFQWRKTH